jgi:DNA-binding MarR family transcriptional regulator
MAQLVDHLERFDYVERVPDPLDGRAKLVRATDRGNAVFSIAQGLMADVDARLDERLGKAKKHRLRILLQELGDALEPERMPGTPQD